MSFNIICAEVVSWARKYDGPKFHALLCDPPYHLAGGFMGRYWDKDGPDAIAFQPETWSALAEHLHPGGFILAFASSRGWHRLACAMEDAGMVIQPSLFVWLNSQAFPKSTRIDTAIDKGAGAEREVLGTVAELTKNGIKRDPSQHRDNETRTVPIIGGGNRWAQEVTAPATPLARAWQGHRYGGQILKNCAEPIICAQKPWTNPRLDCIVETGAGSLWVDGGRIVANGLHGTRGRSKFSGFEGNDNEFLGNEIHSCKSPEHPQGRWPSNFALVHQLPHPCPSCDGAGCEACHGEGVVGGCRRVGVKRVRGAGWRDSDRRTHSDHIKQLASDGRDEGEQHYADPDGLETVTDWRCAEGCPARKLGEMSGPKMHGAGKAREAIREAEDSGLFGLSGDGHRYGDKGTAARFYQQCGWEYECAESCPAHKLDEQAGERRSAYNNEESAEDYAGQDVAATWGTYGNKSGKSFADKGGASRFYAQADWSHEIAERLAASDPVRYCPKAAKSERAAGLDDFFWRKDKGSPTGFVRISKDEWEALGEEEERIRAETGKRVSLRAQGNIHPTQKPISLNRWLATLLLPPEEYAPCRIMVPFAGKMSEAIGAMLAGWDEIVAIEMIPDYCDAGEARMEFWADQGRQMELAL